MTDLSMRARSLTWCPFWRADPRIGWVSRVGTGDEDGLRCTATPALMEATPTRAASARRLLRSVDDRTDADRVAAAQLLAGSEGALRAGAAGGARNGSSRNASRGPRRATPHR